MSEPSGENEGAKPASPPQRKRAAKLNVPKPPEPPPPPHWIIRATKSTISQVLVWPLVLVIGGFFAWEKWGEQRLGRRFAELSAESIVITPPPEYIRSNVALEVYRTHQLGQVSLLNRLATAAIAEAFRAHPWVDDVLRVEKHAEGVEVQLRYRQPVGMVRVKSKHPEITQDGLFPIDGNGILLPVRDFSGADSLKFIHIEIPNTYPASDEGLPYGDDRIVAAAAICRLLHAEHKKLSIAAIALENPVRRFDEGWNFLLIREDRSKIIWGSPPGSELAGEPLAEEKLQQLLAANGQQTDLRLASRPKN